MSGLCVPTVKALRGLKTSRPRPSTLIPLHIWSPSKSSVLSLTVMQEVEQLGAQRGRRRSKKKTAFQACFRLSEMGGGKGWVWKKGGFFKAFCTCL